MALVSSRAALATRPGIAISRAAPHFAADLEGVYPSRRETALKPLNLQRRPVEVREPPRAVLEEPVNCGRSGRDWRGGRRQRRCLLGLSQDPLMYERTHRRYRRSALWRTAAMPSKYFRTCWPGGRIAPIAFSAISLSPWADQPGPRETPAW